jgi:hypothetical protein
MSRRFHVASVVTALVSSGCDGAPATTLSPEIETPAPSSFIISLPLRAQDYANSAFGIIPFGAHIGDHGIDGHPGWDIEYALGTSVLAAADGVVQSVLPGSLGTEWSIQITHRVGGRDAFRTIYGVASPAPGVATGAAIRSGQSLGVVNRYTRTIGTTTVTYAFTHFQLDDFSADAGLTNRNAVSPERFLTADAQRTFATMWSAAAYTQELTEPFATNPRDVVFPLTRTWRLSSGGLPAQIDVTRAGAMAVGYTYVLRGGDGALLETGTATVDPLARPLSAIDLVPAGSAQPRRGAYSILDGVMQLDFGPPGAPRPISLAGASRYVTSR